MANDAQRGTHRVGDQKLPTWLVLFLIVTIVVVARRYNIQSQSARSSPTGDATNTQTENSDDHDSTLRASPGNSSLNLPDESEPQVPVIAPEPISNSRPVDSTATSSTDEHPPLAPFRKKVGNRGPPPAGTAGDVVLEGTTRDDEPRNATPNAWSKIEDQTIRDLNGKIVFQGTIDLKPTLDRIERGDSNRHRNDGTTFQNREGRLPRKPGGYYKEYVHPTKGEHGPGPQRVIIGRDGEIWYTPDHYKTFKRLKKSE